MKFYDGSYITTFALETNLIKTPEILLPVKVLVRPQGN